MRAACIALLAAVSLAHGGCASAPSRGIPRTLDGVAVRGPFVPPSAYEALIRAELALASGQPRAALPLFELATTAPDEDAYLLSRLAYAQLESGQSDAAARTLDEAQRIDPCSEGAWLVRGALAERSDDLPSARAAYQRASACAPRSARGELALAELHVRQGDRAAALDVLVHASERPYANDVESELVRSLRDADPAALAHALASLGTVQAPSSLASERAIELALARGLPRLAARIAERTPAELDPLLEARLLAASGAREQLAGLVARHVPNELGGYAQSAELALAAGAFERAELDASRALVEGPSDDLRALRVRALLGLGRTAEAAAGIVEVASPALRQTLLREALARTGASALAAELASTLPRETQ